MRRIIAEHPADSASGRRFSSASAVRIPPDTDMVSLPQKMHRLTLLSQLRNFFQCLMKHLLVQTQVSHQFLQPLIFILHLPQTPQFRYTQTGEFPLPVIKSGFRNAHLSADFPDACAGFSANEIYSSVYRVFFMAMCFSVRWKKGQRLQFSQALFSGRGEQPHILWIHCRARN